MPRRARSSAVRLPTPPVSSAWVSASRAMRSFGLGVRASVISRASRRRRALARPLSSVRSTGAKPCRGGLEIGGCAGKAPIPDGASAASITTRHFATSSAESCSLPWEPVRPTKGGKSPGWRQGGGVGHEGQRRGCIVNIPSVKGPGPIGSSIAYAVSNASPIHLTRCITIISPDSSRSLSGSGGGETALIERHWASLCPRDISKSLRTPRSGQQGAALRPAFPRYSVKA